MNKAVKRRLARLESFKAREDHIPDAIEIVFVAPGEKPGERRVVRTLTMHVGRGEQTWNPPLGEDDGDNQ